MHTPGFSFGDFHKSLARRACGTMHIGRKSFSNFLSDEILAYERVGHPCRFDPASCATLLRPCAEKSLIPGIRIFRETIFARLCATHTAIGRAIHVVPHARHTAGCPRIISGAAEQARYLIGLITLLPPAIRSIMWIGINMNIITIFNPEHFRIVRVDIDISFAHKRHAFVFAMHVAIRTKPDRDDISINWSGVRAVSIFGSMKDKTVTIFLKRMLRRRNFTPWFHHMPRLTSIGFKARRGDTIIFGAFWTNSFMWFCHNHIWFIER